MEKVITVKTEPSYDVKIYEKTADTTLENSCKVLAKEIAAFNGDGVKMCIVTDETVESLYLEVVMNALREEGITVDSITFPPGENTKSVSCFGAGLDYLAENHYTRKDVLIALGGGVIGDLTGFMAASFLRGVKYIQIPTTLLSCVDSSVGGKTAINLTYGKNLAGAFWQPRLVLINEIFLDTLSQELILDGMAEIIKCAIIGDKELFDFLMDCDDIRKPENLTYAITHAITLKRGVVEEDERDTGSRQLLNLGHTLAHGIEGASNFGVSHGHAVASGMYLITKASAILGWTKEDYTGLVAGFLEKLGYTLIYPYGPEILMDYLLSDKKRSGDTITLVIPEEIGASVLKKIPVNDLSKVVEAGFSGVGIIK